MSRWPLANNRLEMLVGTEIPRITTGDRLLLLLPFLMWIVAALLTWVLVNRLFIRPLRQLQRAVVRYEPGDARLRPSAETWARRPKSRSFATPSLGPWRGSRNPSRAWPTRSKGSAGSFAKSITA